MNRTSGELLVPAASHAATATVELPLTQDVVSQVVPDGAVLSSSTPGLAPPV